MRTPGSTRCGRGFEASEIVLRVRDTGVGISPEMLPLVFDRCAQADRSLLDAGKALGVGTPGPAGG